MLFVRTARANSAYSGTDTNLKKGVVIIMIKYDAVIFDLDGTLLNTLDDLHSAVQASLEAEKLPARSLEEVRRFVGNGIRLLIERAVPDGTSSETANAVFERFKSYYSAHCEDNTRPYDGVTELLEKLKSDGVPCAIVSNKADFAVKKLSDTYFNGLIKAALGEREGIEKKPAPDSVFEAVRLLDASRPVYVGDSEVDVATAKNAGIDGIFVDWGFRDRATLTAAGANVIVSDAAALYERLGEK